MTTFAPARQTVRARSAGPHACSLRHDRQLVAVPAGRVRRRQRAQAAAEREAPVRSLAGR